jgi:hypothetical protein
MNEELSLRDEQLFMWPEKRKCKACGEAVVMLAHWWEFVSENCDPCETLSIQKRNAERVARAARLADLVEEEPF